MKEIKLLVDDSTTIYDIAKVLSNGVNDSEFNIYFTGTEELILYQDKIIVAPAND